MLYKKLNKTLDEVMSRHYASEVDMLSKVMDELVRDKSISIIGGRVWHLDEEIEGYRLAYQTGKMDKIDDEFILYVAEYPHFDQFIKERTILSYETNELLKAKGIFQYAASGVGKRLKVQDQPYYEYVLAFNSPQLTKEFKYLLNIIATVLTSRLKTWRTSSSEESLKMGLDKAKQLIKRILPEHEHKFHDYDIYGVTVPAEILGGDFFDYLLIGEDEERLAVTCGDAASKGVSAAAEAMYISGAIRMATTFEIKIASVMKRMNRLVNQIFGDDKFTSLFFGELTEDKGGLFLYANAGQNPPIFYKKRTGELILLEPTGPVLGPAPEAYYSVGSITFEPGDFLCIYSDGVVESADDNFDFFGEERLEKLLIKKKDLSPKDIALNIIDDVIKFSRDGEYHDDMTIVIIKRNENGKTN